MKTIEITTYTLMIAVIGLLSFGPSSYTQAAQSETDAFSCINVTEIPQIECEALVAIYNGTDGPNWTQKIDWLVTNTPCSWYGVICSTGHVTQLNLDNDDDGNRLSGAMPSTIGDLTALTYVDLSNNNLSSLPTEIGKLTNLIALDLSSNQLSILPTEISKLTSLTELSLGFNQLSSLPTEISNLTSLTTLYLSSNQLDSLPIEIGDLTNLTTLYLSSNQLISLPTEIGKLTSLTALYLSYNQLISLPTEIGNLSSLTWLELNFNQLDSLPTEIGNLTSLIKLYLYSNQLSSLPSDFTNLVGLNDLYVSNNHLVDLNVELRTFLDQKDLGWASNQTPPAVITLNYESDDNCANATAIEPSDPPQAHTFHAAGDIDWSTFTAPTAGLYRVEVDIPEGSRADVNLAYYTECGTLSTGRWLELFTPGVRMDIEADAGETFYLELNHSDDGVGGEDVIYNLSIRALPDVDTEVRRAVIIVAGRYRLYDTLRDNINETAEYVYQLFQNQEVEADDIRVLAAENILGYDDKVTEDNVRLAITDWAVERLTSDADKPVKGILTLYIIDHGDPDLIYLDKHKDQYLKAADLDQWLGELEVAVPNILINVIIEACHSGSFIEEPDSISSPGRIIITSTSTESDAYASRNGIHFSDAFVTLLQQGRDLATSFDKARENVRNLYSTQRPWLDANGNGIHNESDDAIIASERGFNYTGTLGDENWPPHIFSAAIPNGVHNSSGTIWVDARDNQSVQDVWAVIYPPGYVAPEIEHELIPEQLDTILLNGQRENQFMTTYHGFRACGPYRVVIHAQDRDGLQATPVTLTVNSANSAFCQFLPLISR